MEQKPLLSVGIIFKNEIRCVERCLKSITPLKGLADVEIVMADTGSTDGSREVAERYADILIDFPWVNDFAAARNAVMDRCSGKWYFSIDCDEWLDGDLERMIRFLEQDQTYDYASLVIRNYKTLDLGDAGEFSDFSAIRMLRMSTGLRFEGAVHERWPGPRDGRKQTLWLLTEVLLRHDGYAPGVWDGTKVARNLALLRKRLEESPNDLLAMMQLTESSGGTPEYATQLRQAVKGVKDKLDGWDRLGPPILRNGVNAAAAMSLPEFDEWLQMAEEWFPDSIFTRVDVRYCAAGIYWNRKEYAKCIEYSEQYFQAVADYDAKKFNVGETLYDVLSMTAPTFRQNLLFFQIGAYIYNHQPEKALEAFQRVDGTILNPIQAENLSRALTQIQWATDMDVSDVVRRVWEQINMPTPSEAVASQRRERFLRNAAEVFRTRFIRQEPQRKEFHRHAYGVFKALEGECTLGIAAAIMDADEPAVLEEKLSGIENWDELPTGALEHAILHGARFPLPDRTTPLELMDRLAVRLAKDGGNFAGVIERVEEAGDLSTLSWARAVLLAAVKTQNWKDAERGMGIARKFARVEGAFVPRCYDRAVLTDESIWVLPVMHRFGWYCAKAFEAKDAGRAAECVRLLRKGLETAPEMKSMVEFLLEQIEREERESAIASAPPELLELAGQVRGILEQYPPDDPAVKELKNSPVYQKVAYLIEEPATPGLGGIKQ